MKEFNFDFENLSTNILQKNKEVIQNTFTEAGRAANELHDGSVAGLVFETHYSALKLSIDITSTILEKYHEELMAYLSANYVRRHD